MSDPAFILIRMDEPNEVTKPANLAEELSELIEKKRAENKLLQKLSQVALTGDPEPLVPSMAQPGIKTEE